MKKIKVRKADLNVCPTGDLEQETEQTAIHLEINCLERQLAEMDALGETIYVKVDTLQAYILTRKVILTNKINVLKGKILYTNPGDGKQYTGKELGLY